MPGRFAALLEDRGIFKGDRVLLWDENGAEWVAAFYGCMLRGVMCGSSRRIRKRRVRGAHCDGRKAEVGGRGCGTAGEASAPGFGSESAHLKSHSETALVAFEDWPRSLPSREAGAVAGLSRETPLQILFTSGTTGDPKGIVHTHGNVLASIAPIEQGAQRYLRYEKLVHPLRFLHTLAPESRVRTDDGVVDSASSSRRRYILKRACRATAHGDNQARAHLGACRRSPGDGSSEDSSGEHETRARRTGRRLARHEGAGKRWWVFRDVHRTLGFKFWALISGGGALAGPLEQFWNALGLVVVQGYGMTETTALITLNHPFHVASGTIGKPLPGREVKIGPDGEVLVKGPMISTATWSWRRVTPTRRSRGWRPATWPRDRQPVSCASWAAKARRSSLPPA